MEESVAKLHSPPKPARAFVPDWYKKSKRWRSGKPEILEGGGVNKDIKLCIPFLEAMTAGYCITLPGDVLIERKNGRVGFAWNGARNQISSPLEVRPKDMATELPRPAGHDHDLYAWNTTWGIEVPEGYSCLFTHPFNRFDLPFTTTNGFVESDGFSAGGGIPFFLKEGFEGVIPEGTPIIQVVPIKREGWKSEVAEYDPDWADKQIWSISKYITGGYRKHWWVKKTFE
jgi:hypothetical protein